MTVQKVGEKFRRNICHNEVSVAKVGGGMIICCGTAMIRIQEKGAPVG